MIDIKTFKEHVCDENCITDVIWGCAKESAQMEYLMTHPVIHFDFSSDEQEECEGK